VAQKTKIGGIEMKNTPKVELAHFGQAITTKEVFSKLDEMGFYPLSKKQVNAYDSGIQGEFPIIALGTIWQNPLGFNGTGADSLRCNKSDLPAYLDGLWSAECRFAAARITLPRR